MRENDEMEGDQLFNHPDIIRIGKKASIKKQVKFFSIKEKYLKILNKIKG